MIEHGELDSKLAELYGSDAVEDQRYRYIRAIDEFSINFDSEGKDRDIYLFSVSGRSEICGNHTDHNCGLVIGCAVDLDLIAVASPTSERMINLKSAGYPLDTVSFDKLSPSDCNKFSSSSIIAGICSGFEKRGYSLGGFDAYTTNNVYKGSGLSSSAAFEVAVGTMLSCLHNNGSVDPVEIAKISQYAEREFFGKACGLMDQAVCAVGGLVMIDFENESAPEIEKLNADFSKYGYSMCITNTGGSHANLSDDYSAVPAEMKKIAEFFGKKVLRGLTMKQLTDKIPELRDFAGDRAILRAMHFIEENDRVIALRAAMESGDMPSFIETVLASGRSSCQLLQNIYSNKAPDQQGISLALAVTELLLKDKKSAWRVHGGGFAGTVQAFVPNEYTEHYREGMDAVFGKGACTVMRIRNVGAVRLA